MRYSDFPECLPRYAWLLDQGDNAFDCRDDCKACGEPVARADRQDHLEQHRKQLARIRRANRTASLAKARAGRTEQIAA
jgi:hypothetical protein